MRNFDAFYYLQTRYNRKKKPQQAGRRLYATYRQVTATASLPAHFIRQATPQLKIIICNLLVFQEEKKNAPNRSSRARYSRVTGGRIKKENINMVLGWFYSVARRSTGEEAACIGLLVVGDIWGF